jgi:hypothetical protein
MYEEMSSKTESRIKRKYGIEDEDRLIEMLRMCTPYEMQGNGW